MDYQSVEKHVITFNYIPVFSSMSSIDKRRRNIGKPIFCIQKRAGKSSLYTKRLILSRILKFSAETVVIQFVSFIRFTQAFFISTLTF